MAGSTGPDRDETRGGYHPPPPPNPPPPPPPRRFPVAAIVVAAVVVLALAVGIPVALLTGRDAGSPVGAAADPAASAPVKAPPTTAGGAGAPTAAPRPPPTLSPPPPPAEPASLSGPQRDLWGLLTMDGVDPASCRGYPPGESVTARVSASIECRTLEPAFEEPIYYYRFPDAAATDEYLALRAAEVDSLGDCGLGEEDDGTWNLDGVVQGRLICVDNLKDGTTFFKMVWSSDAGHLVAVIQNGDPSITYDWWFEHGGGQF